MDVTTGDAKNRLSELIRLVEEERETIVITRHGKPVAQIGPAPRQHTRPRLGGMKGRIRLLKGWDAPVDPDRFMQGEL